MVAPAGRQGTGRYLMYYVYAIKSLAHNYIYVGISDDIKRRISEHNKGYGKTTSFYKPFKLIHSEKISSRIKARKREKYLKSGFGKEFLKNL